MRFMESLQNSKTLPLSHHPGRLSALFSRRKNPLQQESPSKRLKEYNFAIDQAQVV